MALYNNPETGETVEARNQQEAMAMFVAKEVKPEAVAKPVTNTGTVAKPVTNTGTVANPVTNTGTIAKPVSTKNDRK